MFGGNWWTGKSGVYMNTDTPGNKGFRSWSNADGIVTALRTFENPLNSGETFNINLGHWGGNNGTLSIELFSDSLPVFNISLISGNSYWQAYDGSTFDLSDSNGSANYFTTDNQNAQFSFTYHGGNSYGMSLIDDMLGMDIHLIQKLQLQFLQVKWYLLIDLRLLIQDKAGKQLLCR